MRLIRINLWKKNAGCSMLQLREQKIPYSYRLQEATHRDFLVYFRR
jgi:hypothetical protein